MPEVSQDHFSVLLAESRTAFRLEHQREPLPGEQAAVQHWQQGKPMVPWEWPPWRDWLDLAWRHTSTGGSISRVRLVDDPPTPYQQWAVHCTPWHERSGDHIRYLPCQVAEQLGIPIENWWLFDDAALLLMSYGRGELPLKTLVSDPEVIAKHQAWRELALTHAVTAATVTV
jgi:hypothetical protein